MSEGGANTVLITGGAKGLGAAIARRFAAANYNVAIADVLVDETQALAAEFGDKGLAIELDVRDKASFASAKDAVIDHFGALDALVNNAAVTQVTPVFEVDEASFDAVLSVNLRGAFLGCQVLGEHFRDAGRGRIVNIASLAGQNGGAATGVHYAVSKGGILTLTKVFARELASSGVTVNAIAPGPLDLENVRAMLPPAKLDTMVATIPVGHLGSPEFIADMAVMLASEEASSVTGAVWDANGGLYMR